MSNLSTSLDFEDGINTFSSSNGPLRTKIFDPFRAKVEATLKDIETTFVMLIAHTYEKHFEEYQQQDF